MDIAKISIFIFLVIISFSIERYYITCYNITLYTIGLSIIHHIFSVYLYFGTFIFKFYLFNILIGFATIFGWFLFKNRCFLSIYYNKLCGIPKKEQFHDIINYTNKFIKIPNLHYYILFLIFIYNFYHLCVAKKV